MLAIVVLQYREWQQTIACLQSLLPAVRTGQARVIVVDNPAPGMDAVAPLHEWMAGTRTLQISTPIAVPSDAPVGQWQRLRPEEPPSALPAWSLICSPENDGFGRGVNRGLRAALADARVTGVWVLNNDTVVAAGAVEALREALVSAAPDVGQWGTSVRRWDAPDLLQCAGWWRWNRWLATPSPLGADTPARTWPTATTPPAGDGYVYGASWLLRADALRDVGLLDESAFLYGEELDWTCRARPRWRAALVPAAVVYHREGAAIGAQLGSGARSARADADGVAARLRLTRRFFAISLPCVYLALLGAALNRLRRGQPDRAASIVRALLTPSAAPQWPPASPPLSSDPRDA